MKRRLLHTFVISAYGESPYLEECIQSLLCQTIRSEIIMVTHTPSQYLRDLAGKYQIPLRINGGEGGITQDWNYGLRQVRTRFATIAHQDDTYEPDYARQLLARMTRTEKPLIAFSDYYELRGAVKTRSTKMLKIKELMLLPLRPWQNRHSIFWRRRVLSLGDAICCPSVMYCLSNLHQPVFRNHFICSEDWEAWEKISRQKGDFIYVHQPLMSHRIHESSTTTKMLESKGRGEESMEMYRKFWPEGIARLLNHFYADSEKSNQLDSRTGREA